MMMDSRTKHRLFCDWLGISDESLETPGPCDLREVFQKAFRKLGLAERYQESSLVESWPELIGATLSAHCQPRTVRRGVLLVLVDHSAWLHQITLGHKADILSAVQERFPHLKVKSISLKIGSW